MPRTADITWCAAHDADDDFLDACHQLFEQQPQPGFYHHLDWLLAANEHLLDGELQLGLARSANGDPEMVLPIINPSAGSSGGKGAGRLRLLAHDHLSLNDVLLHPSLSIADVGRSLKSLLAAQPKLSQSGRHWAALDLLNIPDHSLLTSTAEQDTAHWLRRHGRDSNWFDLRQDTVIPGKLRRNLTRLRKKLDANHSTQTTLLTDQQTDQQTALQAYQQADVQADEQADQQAASESSTPSATDGHGSLGSRAFDDFLAVESSGWKSQGDATAIALSSSLVAFYKALLTPRRPGLNVVINRLSADGHVIAAQFGLQTPGTLSLLKIGYDEAWSSYSPGSLLLADLIAGLTARSGAATNNQKSRPGAADSELPAHQANAIERLSLVTAPHWAERWHPQRDPVWHMNLYANTLHGRALRLTQHTKTIIKQRLRSTTG